MLRVAGLRRLVIAGGSGFLGVSLAHHLADADFSVVLLSRRPPRIERAVEARHLGCPFAGSVA